MTSHDCQSLMCTSRARRLLSIAAGTGCGVLRCSGSCSGAHALRSPPSFGVQVMEELQGVKDDIAGAESLAAQLGDLRLSLEVLELEVAAPAFCDASSRSGIFVVRFESHVPVVPTQ